MKNIKILFSLLFLTVFSLGYGQITGSAHDLSGRAWAGGNICIVCHTPHNGYTGVSQAPLWNHEVTAATFTMYSGSTMDATVGLAPSGESLLCLSCHDGTVALDSYGSTPTTTDYITGSRNLGTDLSNDHPISITYDAALATADGDLYDPTTASSGLGGFISDDLLFGGDLQCASCHDVHNASGFDHLLRIENVASALCLTCHDK